MLDKFKQGLINLSRNNISMGIIGICIICLIICIGILILEYQIQLVLIILFLTLWISAFYLLLIYISKQEEEFIQKNSLINIVLSNYSVVLLLIYIFFLLPNVWVLLKVTIDIDNGDLIQILICWTLISNIISLYISYNFKKFLSK